MILVLSTLLHYLALAPVRKYPVYSSIIGISTTLSVIYHIYDEHQYIMYPDYIMAGVWFLTDMALSPKSLETLAVNSIIFIINIGIPYNKYYDYTHSAWHLLSAYKAWHVSKIIGENS